jgi:hypothetical protein
VLDPDVLMKPLAKGGLGMTLTEKEKNWSKGWR